MPAKRLTDIATRHQVLLERLKTGVSEDFATVFDKVERATIQVLAALQAENIGKLTLKELNATLAELRAQNVELLNLQTRVLFSNLGTLAEDSAIFEATTLRSLSPKLKVFTPSFADAYRQAVAQPLSATGELLDKFISDWTKAETDRVNNTVRKAWGEGWTNPQLVKAIRGSKALDFKDGLISISKRNAEAVARTAVQHVASNGRMATWEANKDIVVGYIFVATLDSVTTQICRSLDGKEFQRGSGPVPPVHIKCRSTTRAKLDPALGLGFLEKGATRSAEFGPVPANQTYYDWLKNQPKEFQKEALGATRAKLFQDGGLSAKKFAELNLGRNFKPLTLEEMRKISPVAFLKAGIP